jgi:hypothetical protein
MLKELKAFASSEPLNLKIYSEIETNFVSALQFEGLCKHRDQAEPL